jgi:virC1 protein
MKRTEHIMIITIGSYKGGTGKSTIATNLATEFHHRGTKVILIEADPIVGTSSQWAADREENGYDTIPVVRKTGRLKKTLEDFAKTYDIVIIDAPGKDSVELRSAAVVSDLLVVPTAPTTPDLDSTRGFLASMDEARDINENLIILVTISQASHQLQEQLPQDHRRISIRNPRRIRPGRHRNLLPYYLFSRNRSRTKRHRNRKRKSPKRDQNAHQRNR